MSRKNPVRSSQIIMPYGVGALITQRQVSLIVAGLDSLFPDDSGAQSGAADVMAAIADSGGGSAGEPAARSFTGAVPIPEDARRARIANTDVARPAGEFDEREFIIREHRLEARLGVASFRLPPDYREPRRGLVIPNAGLTIPVLRFPQWNFCSRCARMEFLPLTQKGRAFCRACSAKGLTGELYQMPFVALCERGHIQDFPWSEWVHRAHRPACRGEFTYVSSGGGTPAAQKIKCHLCGAVRSLHRIDQANYSDTYLSFNLAKDKGLYLCRGQQPWLGLTTPSTCGKYLQGNLRGAGNVWFAQTASAIYLPENSEQRHAALLAFVSRAEVRSKIASLEKLGGAAAEKLGGVLKIMYPAFLDEYPDAEIAAALDAEKAAAKSGRRVPVVAPEVCRLPPEGGGGIIAGVSEETAFRYPEYLMLREEQARGLLITRRAPLDPPAILLNRFFARLVQVHTLRETRVFTGFSRIFSSNALPLAERKAMLRRPAATTAAEQTGAGVNSAQGSADWLPATSVYGEGLFLELDMEKFNDWAEREKTALQRHLEPLKSASRRFGPPHSEPEPGQTAQETLASDEKTRPLFILLHTLAHLIITELTFECGYSTAALRERIYVSEAKAMPMAGILIYTAAGDSEGTLGGLVRMGTADTLERVLRRALAGARWCASDPGCSEVGMSQGQGPDSCNLAACHSCALLPETACEEFNRFLDRALLVTLPGAKIEGFFDGF